MTRPPKVICFRGLALYVSKNNVEHLPQILLFIHRSAAAAPGQGDPRHRGQERPDHHNRVAGEQQCIDCDTVIASVGYLPNTTLYDEIKDLYGEKVHLIGDCKTVSNLLNATWSAAELVQTF